MKTEFPKCSVICSSSQTEWDPGQEEPSITMRIPGHLPEAHSFRRFCVSGRDRTPTAVLRVLKAPRISQDKLPRPRAAVPLSFIKSILWPIHLHLLGSWHFHTACSKEVHRLPNGPTVARGMTVAAPALTGPSPSSVLLTCP